MRTETRDFTIQRLKRKIYGDSLDRKRDLDKLLRLVRSEEREKAEKDLFEAGARK